MPASILNPEYRYELLSNGVGLVARIRSLHPDICIDKRLADMDDARAERTFMRLWTYCDDDGRAIDDSRLIKAAIYPRLDSMSFDEVEVDISKLAKWGFIVRYRAEDEGYLHIPSFSVWQKPNRKVDSKLPTPPSVSTHVLLSEDSVSTHEQLPAVVVVVDVDGDGDGGEGDDAGTAVVPPKKKPTTQVPENFAVDDSMRLWAKTNAIPGDIDRHTEEFIDHYRGTGAPHKDWVATWRNWMRRVDRFGGPSRNGKPAPVPDRDFFGHEIEGA